METAVKTLKKEVLERISALEDLETLQGVRRVIDYFHPKPMTEEELQAKLEKAREAIKRGEVLSLEELKEEVTLRKNRRNG
jgi:hypothetical protein